MRDLVVLEKADWVKLLEQKVGGITVGYPPHINGKDDVEKKENYASAMFQLVERAFPMPRLTHLVSKDTFTGKDDLLTFLNANTEFEFDKVYLERYLKDNKRLRRVKDKPALKTRLKSMQRLYKLTPRYEEMRLLMDQGVDSAWALIRKGKAHLNESFADVMSKEQLAEIFDKAQYAALTTVLLFSKYKEYGPGDPSNTPELNIPVLPGYDLPKEIAEDVSNWTEMFGPFNLCECEHCRSVYSPAAYMVDL
ncbi:MAG: hypothetical protein GY940_08755, partial [bacterium]|nr:hypothetical protein [bacterium]